MVLYDLKFMLALRFAQETKAIPRQIRKTLFKYKVWNAWNQHRSAPGRCTSSSITQPSSKWKVSHTPIAYPSLLLANARSVVNKLEEVQNVVVAVPYDVAVVTESWLHSDIPDECVQIDGYSCYRDDRMDKRGGGILCYVRDTYPAEFQSVASATSAQICYLWLAINNLAIIAVYHPYFASSLMENDIVCEEIDSVCAQIVARRKHCGFIICGDFNALSTSPSLCNLSSTYGLANQVSFSTRGNQTLDLILTNVADKYTKATKLAPLGCSDHAAVGLISRGVCARGGYSRIIKPDYSPANKQRFLSMVRCIPFLEMIAQCACLSELTELVLATLKSVHDFSFPDRTLKVSPFDKPWMTTAIRAVIRRRDVAYRKGHTTKFKHYRTKVKKMISAARNGLARKAVTNSRKGWQTIRTICGLSAVQRNDSLSPDDFAQYFMSVYQNDCRTITYSGTGGSFVPVVTEQTVREELRLSSKNAGIESVPAWVYSSCADVLAPIVTFIMNASFSTGTVPQILKFSIVRPIAKVGKPSTVSDYRPISLLSPIHKIMERLVLKYWLKPICSSDLFNDQFAFVPFKGRGTTVALTLLYGCILRFLDKPGIARVILADMSKAFDRALPSHCVERLDSMGAPVELLYWLFDYMNDRWSIVLTDLGSSTPFSVTSGVPQGSVLGPLIFAILFSSYRPLSTDTCQVRAFKYADDLSIVCFARGADDDKSQMELEHLYAWASSHNMIINSDKTKVLDFTSTKKFTLPHLLDISGHPLCSVTTANILGLYFQSNMRWDTHVNKTSAKASKCLFYILQLRRAGCSQSIMWKVYEAMVRSLLTYGFATFCNLPNKLFDCLDKVERRAKRIIGCAPDRSLRVCCDANCQSMMRAVRAQPDHPLRDLFNSVTSSYHVRSSVGTYLVPPCPRTERTKNSFVRYCT